MEIKSIVSNPVVIGFLASCLLSCLADALQRVAPKPTDKRLYVFMWTLLNGLCGNAVTVLRFLTKVIVPQNEKVLEGFAPGNSTVADHPSGAVAHDPEHGQQ